MKTSKTHVDLVYSIKDERGFLIDRKKRFSSIAEALRFVRGHKNSFGKPLIKSIGQEIQNDIK